MFVKVSDGYKKTLLWALDNGKKIVIAAVGLFLLSFVLLGMVGGEFFPYTDRGYVTISVTMPSQSTLEETEEMISRVNDIVKAHPEVESVLYTVGGETTGVNEGELVVKLVPLSDRDIIAKDFVNAIRPEFASIPSAKIVVGEAESGGGGLGKGYHGRGIGS